MRKMIGSLLLLILAGGVMTLLLGGLVLSPVVSAAETGAGQALYARNAWARPAAAGENSAIYFVLDNRTKVEVKLVSVDCPAAEMSQVHQTSLDGNKASMHPVEGGVAVSSGVQVGFKPGSLHLMLMKLRQPLEVGQSVECTLSFINADPVNLKAEVRQP